jgi:DMSO/TMAO reductase YedYZ molybdopterin-dependent catalytic subunit
VPVAVLIGLLSVAAALASGHAVAGLLDPYASPLVAVGNSAIDLAPAPVKEFAIRWFGERDKLVLLLGMAAVLAGLSAVAGLSARRRVLPGLAFAGVLGAVGIAAVATRPTVGVAALLAPLSSMLTGAGVFFGLHRVAAGGDSDDADQGRRRFVLSATVVAVASGAVGLTGELLSGPDVEASRRAIRLRPRPAAPLPAGADFAADGTPAFLTSNADFYRVDTALAVPRLSAEEWRLRVHGLVGRELELSYADLLSRPLLEKTITMCCVSNEVGGPYTSTARFIGVSLPDLLAEAGVRPGADQLATRSADGWTCGTPVEAIMKPDSGALLAVGMNGEPLPAEHGFPARMVVPGLYGFVSATKWLVDAELTTFGAFDAYWVRRGWARRAPVKTMSRVDRPAPFARVPVRFVAAGTAWAPRTGIDRVEVRVDAGPWRRATLGSEVNLDTWRMWRVELSLNPGVHTIECRATDKAGYTQTSERVEPIPDGATGWHSIQFTTVS